MVSYILECVVMSYIINAIHKGFLSTVMIQDFIHSLLFTEYISCIKHLTHNLTEHHETLKQNTYNVLKDKHLALFNYNLG